MQQTLIDGRYLLQEAIGSGGEARVFRACDTTTGHEVAVRLALKPVTYAAPDSVPTHPNWVQFFHWGVDPQQGAYQVFELLHGTTLEVLIKSGPLNTEVWRLFVEQSLDAVAALHATGWIHGDLNAGNFFQGASGWKLLERNLRSRHCSEYRQGCPQEKMCCLDSHWRRQCLERPSSQTTVEQEGLLNFLLPSTASSCCQKRSKAFGSMPDR